VILALSMEAIRWPSSAESSGASGGIDAQPAKNVIAIKNPCFINNIPDLVSYPFVSHCVCSEWLRYSILIYHIMPEVK
jgi:hypothetical protein